MEMIVRNVAVGYVKIFPELLDRFHRYGDLTIVDLIADKAIEKIKENFVNISELKENIVDLLNKGI